MKVFSTRGDKMDDHNIKKRVISGAVWKFAERILAQAVSLLVSIIIARLLDPSDYGVVSIVTVFFAFANVIISGGLNTALIQKKEADKDDYNTVFTISFVLAVVLYIVLFFSAPFVAKIYEQPILTSIIRVLGLSLPIYAFKSVVCAYISANLQFRKFFFATLGGTLVSAVVGIVLALKGFGAWALVAQQLTNSTIDTLILFLITKLRLSFKIASNRLKGLVRYGYKILLSSLLGVTINQINPLFIGLKYTSADLSFYTKGRSFPETLSSSMTYTISAVLFPALSKYQDEKERLLQYTRLYMKVASFIVFPVMLGFAGIAENFVLVLLGDKWLPAVYYIQIASIATMFDIVAAGNCETIKAMGRSDVFLKIEIIKKVGYFVTLILFLLFSSSPQVLAISLLVCTVIQVVVNSIPNRRLIGYKSIQQIMDIFPNFVIAMIMFFVVRIVGKIQMNAIAVLVLQIFIGVIAYLLIGIISKNKSISILLNTIKRRGE